MQSSDTRHALLGAPASRVGDRKFTKSATERIACGVGVTDTPVEVQPELAGEDVVGTAEAVADTSLLQDGEVKIVCVPRTSARSSRRCCPQGL